MHTFTYYKLGRRWYLDLPEYIEQGGNPDDLERIGAFHEFLEFAAKGETTLAFQMDVQPFADADCLELTASTGERSGGYYHLGFFEGQAVDLELWINTVIFFVQPSLPQRIYLKKIILSASAIAGCTKMGALFC